MQFLIYSLQFLITTIKTDIKILTCGKGAYCSNYKVPLGLWFLLATWFWPLRSFVEASRYCGIPPALLSCLVKKALTAENRVILQAEGEGCQQGARPSLLSSCQTRKRCWPVFEGDNRFALYCCASLPCQAADGEKSGSSAGTAMPAHLGWGHRPDGKELLAALLLKCCSEGGKPTPGRGYLPTRALRTQPSAALRSRLKS